MTNNEVNNNYLNSGNSAWTPSVFENEVDDT